MMRSNTGIILLAAGASSRLGQPKQMLGYHNKSLLQKALDTALETGATSIALVLGANYKAIQFDNAAGKVTVVVNQDWQEGMAASIRAGLTALVQKDQAIDAVIFMVCDQPFVTNKLLFDLENEYLETGKPMIASSYDNSIGTPALFDSSIFPDLLKLSGDAGAKKIMNANPELVGTVIFEEGNIDIDTVADYQRLINTDNNENAMRHKAGNV